VILQPQITNRNVANGEPGQGPERTRHQQVGDAAKWHEEILPASRRRASCHWTKGCSASNPASTEGESIDDTTVLKNGVQGIGTGKSLAPYRECLGSEREDRIPPTSFTDPFARNWSLNLIDGVIYLPTARGCLNMQSHFTALDLKDPSPHPLKYYTNTGITSGAWGRGGLVRGPKGILAQTADGPYDPGSAIPWWL
jgi:hypothetical protein